MNKKVKTIIDLNDIEIRDFLFDSRSYCCIDLPIYFNFSPLLQYMKKLTNLNIGQAKKFNDVNYVIYENKSGLYSYRPLTVLNPIIYSKIVDLITKKENWQFIVSKLTKKSGNIICESLPRINYKKEYSVKNQISNWIKLVEQKSIKLALEYKIMHSTDIANCYSSIYTHSISWALHGKSTSKINHNQKNNLGNKIDDILMAFNYSQTNGIPQGSVVMDIIAEIILKYADRLLALKLKKQNIIEYFIIRYRDDYRIFTNDKNVGDNILKSLVEILQGLNLQLNSDKTIVCSDIITNSIKKDKMALLNFNTNKSSYQNFLLSIYNFSKIHPNSGSIIKLLNKYLKQYDCSKKYYTVENLSIIFNIGIENPRTFGYAMKLIFKILKTFKKSKAKNIISLLIARLAEYPNSEFLEIWLQRAIINYKIHGYKYKITQIIQNNPKKAYEIFNISWADKNVQKMIKQINIIDTSKLKKSKKKFKIKEIDPFYY